jgi:phosphoribosylaminoimidazole-succinocarboxamide synthase
MNKIYEGKAKILYTTENPEEIIQYFKDDTTAFNNEKFAIKQGKGILNNVISSRFMDIMRENGIKTHFIKRIDDRNQLVQKATIIPLEVIVRNVAAGSFSKKFGIERGTILSAPLVEFSYKRDELGDPLIPNDHITLLKIATDAEIAFIKNEALKINEILRMQFAQCGLRLIDFKIEFGKDKNGDIILADEISPDSCRLWNADGQSLDKDLFREDKGDIVEAYADVARKLGIEIQSEASE